MKNQILSLLACTAFFASTPAFCMLPESHSSDEQSNTAPTAKKDGEQQGSKKPVFRNLMGKIEPTLCALPVEHKVSILDHLYEPEPVLSLGCVNKEFNKLVEDKYHVNFNLFFKNKSSLNFNEFDPYNSIDFSLWFGDDKNKFCFGDFKMEVEEVITQHTYEFPPISSDFPPEFRVFLEQTRKQNSLTTKSTRCLSQEKTIFVPSYFKDKEVRLWIENRDTGKDLFKPGGLDFHECTYPVGKTAIKNLCMKHPHMVNTQVMEFSICLSESADTAGNFVTYSLCRGNAQAKRPKILKTKQPETREQGLKRLQPKVRALVDAATSMEDMVKEVRLPEETIREIMAMNSDEN
jgi:hypothetical protein